MIWDKVEDTIKISKSFNNWCSWSIVNK